MIEDCSLYQECYKLAQLPCGGCIDISELDRLMIGVPRKIEGRTTKQKVPASEVTDAEFVRWLIESLLQGGLTVRTRMRFRLLAMSLIKVLADTQVDHFNMEGGGTGHGEAKGRQWETIQETTSQAKGKGGEESQRTSGMDRKKGIWEGEVPEDGSSWEEEIKEVEELLDRGGTYSHVKGRSIKGTKGALREEEE